MGIEMSGKTRERLLYLISPIALLVIWQVLLMAGIGDRRFIPAPSDIAQRFVNLAGSGELEWHIAVTLYRVFAGYFIGAVPAVAIGLLMAMFKPVRIFVDPLIAVLFPIPKIALMPLLLLAFGLGDASKIALVAIAVFFPVVINTYVGAANIEKIYWDVAKNYGASQTVMFTRVVFFGALPTIFAGAAYRACGVVHRAGRIRVRGDQKRHRLPDLEFVGAAAGRRHVRRHRHHRRPRADHLGPVPGDRAQSRPVEDGVRI
jgi:NitT/TauT family transport system permease protein